MTDRKFLYYGIAVAVTAVILMRAVPGATPFAAAQAQPVQQPDPAMGAGEVAALKAEVERLKQVVPDQAHAMADVGYHYSNLWFAARQENWPLAQFMWNEVRSHLRWAVRIIPVRKNAAGQEVDLHAILEALEGSALKDLEATIKAKDKQKFEAAYGVMLDSCVACHQAADKPYIRLQVPERPDTHLLDFRPQPQ